MRKYYLLLFTFSTITCFSQPQTYKWSNGNKKAEGNYKDGEFNGKYINYNNKGIKIEEGTFVHAKKEGETKIWYENNQLKMTGFYKNGYRDSLWTFYYPNNIKQEEGYFKKDNKVNIWKSWYDNNQLEEEKKYEDSTIYTLNFWNKKGEQTITNGNGKYITYFENGNINFKGQFKDGLKDGLWEKFDANQKKIS